MRKVSILINNYNNEDYLYNCIESAINQTYDNLEVIVYDDGSKDNSLEILEKYKNKISIMSNPNYGHSPNENQANAIYQAFLKSSGDIICLLDSDDMFSNDKVQKIVEAFEKDKEITTVQNLMLEMDTEGNLSKIVRPVIKKVDNIKSYIFEKQNFFHLFVPTSGLSFRRSFLEKVLPLEEDGLELIWTDFRLSLLSVLHGKIDTVFEPLSYYRIHHSNLSSAWGTQSGHSTYINQAYIVFNKFAEKCGCPKIKYSQEVYLENTYFALILNEERLKQFVRNNDNIYIWGAGEAGQSIYHFLIKQGMTAPISGFLDANPYRKNENVMGFKVSLPFIEKGIKYIVSPIHAYENIKKQLENEGLVEDIDFIYPYKFQKK